MLGFYLGRKTFHETILTETARRLPESNMAISWKLLHSGNNDKVDIERQRVLLSTLRIVLKEVSDEHNRSVEAFHKAEMQKGKKVDETPNTVGHIIMSVLIRGTNKDL